MKFFLFCVLGIFLSPALADLYRWVDPETGSVKFSSYPPPWYGDPTKSRAPKVQVIPTGSRSLPGAPAKESGPADAKASPAGSPVSSAVPESLEKQRKSMLQQIPALASQAGTESGMQALNKHLGALKDLSDALDKVDPQGAAARNAELDEVIQKVSVANPQ